MMARSIHPNTVLSFLLAGVAPLAIGASAALAQSGEFCLAVDINRRVPCECVHPETQVFWITPETMELCAGLPTAAVDDPRLNDDGVDDDASGNGGGNGGITAAITGEITAATTGETTAAITGG